MKKAIDQHPEPNETERGERAKARLHGLLPRALRGRAPALVPRRGPERSRASGEPVSGHLRRWMPWPAFALFLVALSVIELLLVGIRLTAGAAAASPEWIKGLEIANAAAIALLALLFLVLVRSDIGERRRLMRREHARQRFLSEFSQQIRTILRSASDPEAELQAMAPFLVKGLAQLLEVERCGIWFFDDSRTHLDELVTCIRSGDRLESGRRLKRERYPAYFTALESGRALVANDARTHPATCEFADSYLDPAGITAMLDAPLYQGGRLIGAICAEHVGGRRVWRSAEIAFLASVAEILSLGFEVAETIRFKREADRLRAQAERSDRAKSRFIASMSHELRTPLNAILGFTSTLLAAPEKLDERTREYLAYIGQGGSDLLEIINEILDLARVERGKLEAETVPLSPDWLVERAVRTVTPRAREVDVRLEIADDLVRRDPSTGGSGNGSGKSGKASDTPPPDGSDASAAFREGRRQTEEAAGGEEAAPEILADPKLARQALVNILSNAIKASPSGGRIRIDGRRRDGCYEIVVTDEGAGMDARELRAALEPFNQLDRDPYVHAGGGLGLGLPLTKAFMEAQGGELLLESAPEKGTRARLRFLLAR